MRTGTTWLLLAAVCLAAGFYGWLGGVGGADERLRQEASRVFSVRPDRIQELVLDRDGLRIECRRVEGVWRIVVPVNARADAAEMDRLLTVLSELRRGEVITAADRRDAGSSLADYGLDRPLARLEWSDGTIRRELRMGRVSPLGNQMYVQVVGSDEILAVPQTLLHVWPDSVVSLRDRILFHGDPRRAYRAEVRRAGTVLQLQRGDDGVWQIQRPGVAQADPVAVRQWVDRLFDLRIVEFMADVISDPSVYGLDEAATQVTLWTEGQPTGQTLWIGGAIDAQSEWIFARRQDGLSVFAISADAKTAAQVRSHDLRSRILVPFAPMAIDRIQLERQDQRVELERVDGHWHVRSRKQWPADPERVEALIAAWTGARIAHFIDSPEPEEFAGAFAADSLRVRFSVLEQSGVDEAQRWRNLDLVVDDRLLPDGRVLVQRNQERSLYEVELADTPATVTHPLYFWNRRVIDLEGVDVTRVRQNIEGREVDIRYGPAGEIAEHVPAAGVLQTDRLQRAVHTLLTLQADEYLLEEPEDWAVYGLEEPRIVWTLRLNLESGVGRVLRMGTSRPDGRVYARTLGYNTLFLLGADDAALLSQPLVLEDDPEPMILSDPLPH